MRQKKNMDELAFKEKQTSSLGKLYTIQFIQKQNWKKNRIYERFMPFFFIYSS